MSLSYHSIKQKIYKGYNYRKRMIIKQEVFRKIKDRFSLNIYETKVWLALLGKGIASAGEIAELSDVPRSRSYDVLESLEKRGFAFEKIGKPIKFIAVKPNIIIDRMKNDLMEEANEKVESVSNLKDTDDYRQLELLYKHGINPIKMEELSGTLKGKKNIHVHLKDAISQASKSVIFVSDANSIKKKEKIIKASLDALKKKNVDVKIAVNGSDEEIKNISKEFKVNVRKTDLNSRFCIVDKKNVIFMMTKSEDENDTGIWVDNEFFANTLSSMFNLSWDK